MPPPPISISTIYSPQSNNALNFTTSNLTVTGSLTVGNNVIAGAGSSTISYQSFGTESNPVNGGSLTLDTTTSLSTIIELSSSSSNPLSVMLTPSPSFNASQIGTNGSIVIVERSTTGRPITIDPRIQFPTFANGQPTVFTNTGFYASSMSNFTTSTAPSNGGFAVDTIDYYIPKIGFAIGKYNRMFKCLPPFFSSVSSQTNLYTATAPYTLNLSASLSNSPYYGPLTYSFLTASSPAIPAGMSISSNGTVTINQNVGYTGNVFVSVVGSAPGSVIVPVTFGVLPWYVPIITNSVVVPAGSHTWVTCSGKTGCRKSYEFL